MQEKLKQLEILVSQVSSRLQVQHEAIKTLKAKIRQQEESIMRLKEAEMELKALREWKKNTVAGLKRLEARVEKELARVKIKETPLG